MAAGAGTINGAMMRRSIERTKVAGRSSGMQVVQRRVHVDDLPQAVAADRAPGRVVSTAVYGVGGEKVDK